MTRNLATYKKNGLELVVDTNTGETFASASAIAKLLSIEEEVILATRINTYNESPARPGSPKISFDILYIEQAVVAFTKKCKPEFLNRYAKFGVRHYLHKRVGYEGK